ncbi:MAG TPA: patatin family protein [Clostridia bacterium]|nr:patatin family protein [Clostridia bacterium]
MDKTPKVGLVLGAGAAKGFAHLGVLKVLEAENIPFDLIVGCSMGSVFGALYGAGVDLHLLEKMLEHLPQKQLFDLAVPKMGLIRGHRLEALLRLLTKDKDFSQLDIPLFVVAVDIEKGEKVVINEGSVAEAVRASIAIPGIFAPKRWRDRLLVDGAVLERVPVGVARKCGADIVIAVDVKFGGEGRRELKITNIFEVFLHSIELMEREVARPYLAEADILIQPDVAHIASSEFHRFKECIAIGEAAARRAVPQIKQLLAERGIDCSNQWSQKRRRQ